jgi:hypothetical protein
MSAIAEILKGVDLAKQSRQSMGEHMKAANAQYVSIAEEIKRKAGDLKNWSKGELTFFIPFNAVYFNSTDDEFNSILASLPGCFIRKSMMNIDNLKFHYGPNNWMVPSVYCDTIDDTIADILKNVDLAKQSQLSIAEHTTAANAQYAAIAEQIKLKSEDLKSWSGGVLLFTMKYNADYFDENDPVLKQILEITGCSIRKSFFDIETLQVHYQPKK